MSRRLVLATFLALAFAAGVRAQAPAERISGEIIALEGSELRLRPAAGEVVTVHLAANLRLSARSAGSMELLLPGAYVGTTAVPQADGTLRAVEVHVFPESMRGTGEGHRPMDAAPNTMTNATISKTGGNERGRKQAAESTMTNAVVTRVASDSVGRRLTLTYQGGEKVVIVPAGIPISMIESADRSLLTAGTHVVAFIIRQPDGSLQAERVTVGKNGFVP